MRFTRLDLNLLVVLDAILSERNITRAGAQLHLSQSATSGALARLREYFDDPLVVQMGRTLELTPLAQGLVVPVRDILIQIRATVEAKPDFNPATAQRRFSIYASDYAVSALLVPVLRRVQYEAPKVTFDLRSINELSQERMRKGDIDFVIVPEDFASPDHPRETLFAETYTVIAWSENSQLADRISAEQYAAMGHVIYTTTRALSQDGSYLKRQGRMRNVEVAVDNFNLLPQIVAGTHRIATVHTRLAKLWATYLPLKLLDLPFPGPTLVEMLQWHKHRELDPGLLWLRGVLRETAKTIETI